MNDITTAVKQAMAAVADRIHKAAEQGDWNTWERLTKLSLGLKELMDRALPIEREYLAILNVSQPGAHSQTQNTLRQLEIPVTQGMINQNLLPLTDAVKHGLLRTGESFDIEARPSGDRFQTVLLHSGNKLQERGKIGKFYRDAGVKAGDVVLLIEISPGHWQLRKKT